MEASRRDRLPQFLALAKRPDVAAAICEAAADGSWSGSALVTAICSAAHLPLTRQSDVDAVLRAGASHEIFCQHSPLTWSPKSDAQTMRQLALMLAGASAYVNSVHRDVDEVEVVLTKPLRPSELERSLREAGYEQVGLVATGEMFAAMAAGSRSRFTVMTPFLDLAGAKALVRLYEKTADRVARRLIIRTSPSGLPDGYIATAEALRKLGVHVFDYRLEREGGGFETFHAKVVLADRDWAYVGSTNMNQWSLAYSMELGVSLRGRAAGRIARVLDAVLRIASPVA